MAMREAMVLGILLSETRTDAKPPEGCRRGHYFRAVVALRAAVCASPAGLLLQTIQTP